MTLIARAIADLRLVAEYWPGLAELKDPAVFAPRPPSLVTPERRAKMDHDARLERAERIDVAPGEHRDAARAGVLDLLSSLAYDADEIADAVADSLQAVRPGPLPSAFSDPAPLLHFAISRLDDVDHDTGRWIADMARAMLGDITRALCLTYTDQALDVTCVWCKGERSWRVRDLLASLDCRHGKSDRVLCGQCDQQIAIVCESGVCGPPTGDVGTWWRGKPAWPMEQWGWLAKRLTAFDERERMSV